MDEQKPYESYWDGLLKFNKMKKYNKEAVEYMRERMAESEWEGLGDRDMRLILMDGCVGWSNIEDEEVVAQYESIYGDDQI